MNPCWAPQSALILPDPPAYASAFILRRLLSRGRSVDVLYCGDRMWPALRHAQVCRLEPLGTEAPRPGAIVLVSPSGIPDLLRIESIREDTILLSGDADPAPPLRVGRAELIGRVGEAGRAASGLTRRFRRLRIDLGEAIARAPDAESEPEATVLLKYDAQAPFYRGGPEGPVLSERLMDRIGGFVPAGGRILVAGSGAGHECFQLAEAGYRPSGIDFAPAMVAIARDEAARRGLGIDFYQADLRTHKEPSGSLDAVLFTYNVYSFIATRRERVELLERMSRWVAPGGVIFVAPRICRGVYEWLVQTVQRVSPREGTGRTWGDSHTRWIASDGTMHRSYVKVFTRSSFGREIAAAGLRAGPREGGHVPARQASAL